MRPLFPLSAGAVDRMRLFMQRRLVQSMRKSTSLDLQSSDRALHQAFVCPQAQSPSGKMHPGSASIEGLDACRGGAR